MLRFTDPSESANGGHCRAMSATIWPGMNNSASLLVKRLLIHPIGRRVTLQSDNPAYADLPDCALDDIDCVGRVIWVELKVL